MPLLELQCLGRGCGIVQRKVVDDEVSIGPLLIHRTSETDLVGTRLGGRQKACPSCREVLHAGRRPKRGWILIEKLNVYRLVHANHLGRTRKILAGKIFSLQTGLTIAGRERGCGDDRWLSQEVHPRRKGDLSAKLLADAVQSSGRA